MFKKSGGSSPSPSSTSSTDSISSSSPSPDVGSSDSSTAASGATYAAVSSQDSPGNNGVVVFARTLFTYNSGELASLVTRLKDETLNGDLYSWIVVGGVPGSPTSVELLYVGTGSYVWPDGTTATWAAASPPPSPSPSPSPSPTTSSSSSSTTTSSSSSSSSYSSSPSYSASPSPSSGSSGGTATMWIAIVCSVAAVMIAGAVLGVWLYYRRRRTQFRSNTLDGQALVHRWSLARELADGQVRGWGYGMLVCVCGGGGELWHRLG